MKYFYEYKYKKGNRVVGGHNLEEIIVKNDTILLKGVDIIPTYFDYEVHYWSIPLNMHKIEYLKIEPMQKEESRL